MNQTLAEQILGNLESRSVEPSAIGQGPPAQRPRWPGRWRGPDGHRGMNCATSLGRKIRARNPTTGSTSRRNTPTSTESFMAL